MVGRRDVLENRSDNLLTSPEGLGFHDRRRHSLDSSSSAVAVFGSEGGVEKLHVVLAVEESVPVGQPHTHGDVILNQTSQRVTGSSRKVLMVGVGDAECLGAGDFVLREVHVHLVTVEIGVVGVAVGVVHAQCLLSWQYSGAVTHHGRLVECGLTVHDDNVAVVQVAVDLLRPCTASAR